MSTPEDEPRAFDLEGELLERGVAIIGAAGRFPGASSVGALWKNLCAGVESIRFFSEDELRASGIRPRWLAHPDYVPAAGVLDDVDAFDAAFFGISAGEADILDPQHRLLLECAWEALEGAGYASVRRRRNTGVFAGIHLSEYLTFQLPPPDISGVTDGSPVTGLQRATANDKDYPATRVSFKLGLQGPSLNVQTACSTSLVAVHLACQSLLRAECELALAGAATVRVPHHAGYLYSEGMTFSRDGHTRAFDADASGTVFTSGGGFVLLKRLDRALADRDDIWAVIRGSALNNDGSDGKAGFSAPSRSGQARVIREALERARVSADTISYVEAHGTATGIGDPIEIAALTDAFRRDTERSGFCALGSMKTNVGHMVQAAGIGGLIKVALMLRHRELVPHLHFRRQNPEIRFEETPFFVVTERRPWPLPASHPRRAGVSSFGIGGTNTHVVLEEAPAALAHSSAMDRSAHMFALSARSDESLRALAESCAEHAHNDAALADLCFSANTGREHFTRRLAVVAETAAELRDGLRAAVPCGASTEPPRIAFLFTGQGAQHVGMARGLYRAAPVFRRVLDHADELLRSRLGGSLLEVMHGDGDRIHETLFAQPALLAVELGLLELWGSLGLRPSVVLGHSVGEYAAAVAAGILDPTQALVLITERARAMDALPRIGSMAAVGARPEAVADVIRRSHGAIEIAAFNAPEQVVLSGDAGVIESAVREFEGVGAELLRASHAFHSHLMAPALPVFAKAAEAATFRAPAVPFISSVTGGRAESELVDPAYWRDQVRRPVQFTRAARALDREGCQVWLEMGPHPTLLALARLGGLDRHVGLASLRGGHDDWKTLLGAVAALYTAGADLDFEALDAGYARRRVSLPTTPFARRRHWIDPPETASVGGSGADRDLESTDAAVHPLLGRRLRSALRTRQYQTDLAPNRPAWLGDHVVHGALVVPATVYVEMLAAAAADAFGALPFDILDLVIEQPLVLDSEGALVQTLLEPRDDGGFDARIVSSSGDAHDFSSHVIAVLRPLAAVAAEGPLANLLESSNGEATSHFDSVRRRCATKLAPETCFANLAQRGLELGPAFQNVDELSLGERDGVADVRLRAAESGADRYLAHPALLDACLKPVVAIGDVPPGVAFVPTVWERIRMLRPLGAAGSAYVRLLDANSEIRSVSLTVTDAEGRPSIVVEGLHMKQAPRQAFERRSRDVDCLLYEVQWKALPPAVPEESAAGVWWLVGGGFLSTALARALEALGGSVVTEHVPNLRGVVFLGGLDATPSEALTLQKLGNGCAGVVEALACAQELEHHGTEAPLWIVTRGAHAVRGAIDRLSLLGAPLIGFSRVLRAELPRRFTCHVDLDPARAPDDPTALVAELLLEPEAREEEVAVRAGDRFAPRLAKHAGVEPRRGLELPAGDTNFVIELVERHGFDSLRVARPTPREPGPDEVRIRVQATGLNFKDVLSALGRFDLPLGFECAGTVAACGAAVRDLHPGDRVIALASACLAGSVTVPRIQVARAPQNLRIEAAAGLPVPFLTAHYGLRELAGIAGGQTLLITAAAGGVGLAALEIARNAGAEVIALASPPKWPFLQALGVEHVLSTRQTGFAQAIRRITGGKGVDIVLNSLADELLDEAVRALAPGGWFIDIGTSSRWNAERMGSAIPGAHYAQYQLSDFLVRDPAAFRAALERLVRDVEAGRLRPPPLRVFPAAETGLALRHMAQGHHVGKIVLRTDDPPSPAVRPDATYLITGGLGALGLEVAGWLAEQGARHIVLVGRSDARATRDPETASVLEGLSARGVGVRTEALDIADATALRSFLARLDEAGPPLRGVFHAAGVLDDGAIVSQTEERFARVFSGKVVGAFNLHLLTEERDLDFFVLFASQTGLFGTPGQVNYAAANTFLDALAHSRRAAGLAAVSIDWGPWSGSGMAATLDARKRDGHHASGIGALTPAEGLSALGRIVSREAVQVAVLPVDWRRLASSQARRLPALLSDLTGSVREAPRRGVRAESHAPLGADELLLMARDEAARLLGIKPDRLDLARPLIDLGLDSLMAVELRNRIAERTGLSLPMVTMLRRPSVSAIGEQLDAASRASAGRAASTGTVDPMASESTTRAAATSLLVPLLANGQRAPFFCLPGAGGGVGHLGDLAEALGESLPCYALRARGSVEGETPLESISEMAEHYVAAIQSAQAHGPYFLGAYCIGGVVALEVARRLTDAGERIALLALIDAAYPWASPFEAGVGSGELARNILRGTATWAVRKLREPHRGLPARDLLRYLRGRPSQDVLPPDTATELQVSVWQATVRALHAHTPRPYAGPILVLRTRNGRLLRELDPKLGWRRLALGGVEIVEIPGDHHTLLRPPHVSEIARVIRSHARVG